MKTKYYVEIFETSDSESYLLQSIWYDTIEQAREFASSIEYIKPGYEMYVMCAEFLDGGETYGDIRPVEALN